MLYIIIIGSKLIKKKLAKQNTVYIYLHIRRVKCRQFTINVMQFTVNDNVLNIQ